MSVDTITMGVSGKIVEVHEEGLPTFKVQTKLGFAYVWVWEEIEIDFKVGMDFHVDEAPVTFSDGYPIATLKPGVQFFVNHLRIKINEV